MWKFEVERTGRACEAHQDVFIYFSKYYFSFLKFIIIMRDIYEDYIGVDEAEVAIERSYENIQQCSVCNVCIKVHDKIYRLISILF